MSVLKCIKLKLLIFIVSCFQFHCFIFYGCFDGWISYPIRLCLWRDFCCFRLAAYTTLVDKMIRLNCRVMDFVSSEVVRSHTGQPLMSDTIRQRRLSFFGHLCRADTGQDHSRAVCACIRGPPKDWRRRTGRPRQTWLRTVQDDLRLLNFGLATARRRAMDRPAWRLLVDAATSSWHAPERMDQG